MNIFENWRWRSLWLKGKRESMIFNVLNGTKSESVISIQKVVPMFQVKVNVKVWYQNKRLFQGVPRWSKGAKLRETIGRRGVHPLIIRALLPKFYTDAHLTIFTRTMKCSLTSAAAETNFTNPRHRPMPLPPTPLLFLRFTSVSTQVGQFSFKDCDFSVSTFVHPVVKLHSIIIHRPSKMLKSLLSLSSRKIEMFEENEL